MRIVADENIPFVKECFSSIGDVQTLSGRKITPETVTDADCLLVRSITPVNGKLLAGSKVRFVATATIGYEHVDVEYLRQKGIGFASAPGSNANSVAEYIVAALLSVGKKHGIRLEGKSIGIIGVGNVGSRVAKKCAALGMKVKLNDPPLERYKSHRGDKNCLATEDTEDTENSKNLATEVFPSHRGHRELDNALARIEEYLGGVRFLPIGELMGCDFVTLHTPLTKEGQDRTYHLADEKFFKSLKNGCVFINTSRGAVHDTAALKNATGSGKLKAAVLDVWENEPNIDCDLLRMVDIGTPHIAGYSFDGKVAGLIMIYVAACEFFGLKPKRVAADFLPPPAVPEIRIEHVGLDEQELIREVVQQVYVINRDDFNTREIATVEPEKRGRFFDDLRRNYPVRREFQNTTVVLATEDTEVNISRLQRKLQGIGFQV